MRISTSLKYEIGASQINKLQAKQLHLYEQTATGLRVVRPGDDPLAASQAVTVSQSLAANSRFESNRAVASSNLGMADTAVQNSVDVLEAIKGRLVQAGNGSYSASEMQALGAELKSSYAALLTQANATDGNGSYLFSGNQGDTAPYAVDSDGWITGSYQGDAGQRLVQVDQTRQISTSNTADELYGDVFDDLRSVIEALETYDADDAEGFATVLTNAQDSVSGTFDTLVTIGASIGARMNEVSALDAIGSSRSLSYSSQLDDLVGLDEASAYSLVSYYQVALQASTLAFQKIQAMNLFNS
ncbi:MAG: flagellar hook-associated protein FlgL [Comamonas sp.]